MKNQKVQTVDGIRPLGGQASQRKQKGVFDDLVIASPKRTQDAMRGWHGFFPYYAGYPEPFARSLLASARLGSDAKVVDPWNGSGTTTFSASQLGLESRGCDINPVMLIVARARLLPHSEADSLEPLAREIVKALRGNQRLVKAKDPLLDWFTLPTAGLVRALERRIREHLLGDMVLSTEGIRLEKISGLAATFYVALFSVCRDLASAYRSSNPTWIRKPNKDECVVESDREELLTMFIDNIASMAQALAASEAQATKPANVELSIADTVSLALAENTVDFILTSPPYCTRIDYAAATRIELAVLYPLLGLSMEYLGRRMIGSTRVPTTPIESNPQWGGTCTRFLRAVKRHPSKASSGYYYKTHLDYFEKMYVSLTKLSRALKDRGKAVFVVQDSYYKDVHNDLPAIIGEMGETMGLQLERRVDFHISQTMAGVNPHSRTYRQASSATESVLCFQKR
ncbi:site-specific DNA-methyltransferase [Burkholderia pseudomallei]|uniref:site-specific DNA-methyltransferase n=1 Tax=Burkholderia pseudomallei TaxID=28450 RepID=UPI00052AFEFF|nr:site-specific DNA-methyltransferase [Burkholderia pseudomallei]AIV53199.1 DNA methylase family protein [Burkholderia pseudomallei MSHR1153]KGS60048.1 DNA methylase family protein [Burkholderia pseudomallei MSHR5609]